MWFFWLDTWGVGAYTPRESIECFLFCIWCGYIYHLDLIHIPSFLPPFFFPAWFFFLLVRGVEDAFSPVRIRIRTTMTTTSQVLDCMEC